VVADGTSGEGLVLVRLLIVGCEADGADERLGLESEVRPVLPFDFV
jgi:hypothetical protein